MKNDKPSDPNVIIMSAQHSEFVTRDKVLRMLSEEELARVSNAEEAVALVAGDDYLDLENLGRGVLQADGAFINMGHILPRKAIHNKKWDEIVEYVTYPRASRP